MSKASNLDRWGFPRPVVPPTSPERLPASDEALPPLKRRRGAKSPRRARLIACLRELSALRKPGQTYSYAEIGRFCNVSPEYIKQLEASALKKLRNKIDPEILNTLCQN